ncbi:MAG: DNA internalization-related competence protein ComEC/Rec2 [Oscillospiraceae bacterium]|nr:DNA internalization-related competence protein ComEC/Rec2 [Oscillospiraceae bacterium]
MRKLMWFTIGFCGASAIGAYLLFGNLLAVLAVAALILSGLTWLVCRRLDQKPVPAVLLLGLALGLLWFWVYDGGYLSPVRDLDGVITQASIEILDYSYETDYGCAAEGNASWQGRTYRIRLYLNDRQILNPGNIVTGSFKFQTTDGTGEKEATFHRGNGIALIAKQVGEVTVEHPETPWWYYPGAHIRQSLIDRIVEIFPADTAAFAKALLLGDDTDLDYAVNTAFKVTGIRHIIAVSGLHVSILFGLVYMVAGKNRYLTALLGIPVLALFAAVAGFTPSVTRACLMHGLMMVGLLFEREYDPPTALAFSALVMLAVNPLVVTSVSFQLSVGCMVGIFAFAQPMKAWLLDDKRLGHATGKSMKAKLVRAFAGSVSVSLGAISITTPLSALYFGAVSLISPLTNLLTLWVVTLVFYGIMAVCALGLLWIPGAQMLALLVSWPIRYILGITQLLSRIPMAAVYTTGELVVWWLLFVYILLGLFLVMKNRKPMIFSCLAVLSLCAALLGSWIPPMLDGCRMTVLDVGQGQSIILQSYGKTYLVDCGGSYADDAADLAAETLLSMGISRIDGLILTHYDADHAGGAEMLLTRIDADALYLPAWEDTQAVAQTLSAYDGGTMYRMEQDLELRWRDTTLTVITSELRDSGNESSLCVLFQADNCDILITGDRGTLGEELLLRRIDLPELEVLVVGHHGSKYSTGQALLDKTSPQIAVISVDADNRYGHPAQEVLERLEAAGCTVLRTDEDGTIIIRR